VISQAEASNLEELKKEKWQVLCEQISVERDSERMMVLIEELNRVLQARDQRTHTDQRVQIDQRIQAKEESEPGNAA
jgi:hypothetical protein